MFQELGRGPQLLCAALMLPFDIKMQREKRRGNSNITAIW